MRCNAILRSFKRVHACVVEAGGVGAGTWVDERTATLSSFDGVGRIVLVVILVLLHEVLMVLLLHATMTDMRPLLLREDFGTDKLKSFYAAQHLRHQEHSRLWPGSYDSAARGIGTGNWECRRTSSAKAEVR